MGIDQVIKGFDSIVIVAFGIVALFLFLTALAAFVWSSVQKKVLNGKGDTRKSDRDWPTTMVQTLTKIDLNIQTVVDLLSKNGLARKDDIKEVKELLEKNK